MARVTLPVDVVPGSSPLAAMTPTETAPNVANGNQFPYTGREVVLVRNTSTTTARNVRFHSVPVGGRHDPLHNTDIPVPASATRVFGPFGEGWRQSDGHVYVNGDSTDLRLTVIRQQV